MGDRLSLDFDVHIAREGRKVTVRFGDLLKRRTVVSVHMRNNTPTCDRQVASLVASADQLDRLGFDVIGVSRDTCNSHMRYAQSAGVPFTLVSDPDERFAQAADAIVDKVLYGRRYRGARRSACILERDGTVCAVIEEVDTANQGAQVVAIVTGLSGGLPDRAG